MEKLFSGRGKSTPQTQTPKRPRVNDSPELIEFEKLTAEERQLTMFSQIVETKGEVQATRQLIETITGRADSLERRCLEVERKIHRLQQETKRKKLRIFELPDPAKESYQDREQTIDQLLKIH